ncbi:Na/Pi symporter [Bacillus sp. FJAT-44742]|uniref:Na/Pi symporter n=1 Tax=Bacillus sp. FJAT-44742 TaxID=2014005 RepID=UPI000C2323E3|nr:Na/Pi symporter [Bacillus sp. FJAT-44742]
MFDWVTTLFVYIGIFLFGIALLRTGLNNAAKNKIEKLLQKGVSSPLSGLILGTAVTGILQSSSAVIVMTVGLVSAKILTFRQSIGIILGSNIGTCLTLEMLAFSVEEMGWILLLAAAVLLILPSDKTFHLGTVLFGLGCVFVAMHSLKNIGPMVSTMPYFTDLLSQANDHLLWALAAGSSLSAIIQSSTASTALMMTALGSEWLTLDTRITVMLGANIGTCMTALLAALLSSKEAKLTALAHLWINIAGVLVFIPILQPFTTIVTYLSPDPSVQLAHAATLFNVLTSMLFLPFAYRIAQLIEFFHNGLFKRL